MKHHKYFNTIWSERDQEFWWDGTKTGFVFAVIFTSVLWGHGIVFVDWIKRKRKNRKD